MSNKAAFLDRDGTINVDKDYLYKTEDFEYLPNVIEGLRLLQAQGFLLVVITNQSGIARGYYTEEDFLRLDKWMQDDLRSKGVEIAASYYCPHLPNGAIKQYAIKCDCRKPKIGLFEKAIKELDLNPAQCIAIGDRQRDLCFCKEAGCRGYLVGKNKDYTDILEVAKVIQIESV